MNVVYREKARQWEEEHHILEQMMEPVKEVLARAEESVEAEWDRVEDEQGGSMLKLKLRDFAGEVEGSFTPEELTRPNPSSIRLLRLLGDLLRQRNHLQWRQLKEIRDRED